MNKEIKEGFVEYSAEYLSENKISNKTKFIQKMKRLHCEKEFVDYLLDSYITGYLHCANKMSNHFADDIIDRIKNISEISHTTRNSV